MTEAVTWVKWRFEQWRGDEGLRASGLAARGLWIDLLSFMHGGKPYGHLSLNGKPPSNRQIAAMVGMTTEKEVTSLIQELEINGVFSRTVTGMIYSRRLVRDNAIRERGKAFGVIGGNPILKQTITLSDKGDGYANEVDGVKAPPKPREEREKEEEEEKKEKTGSLRSPAKTKGCRLPENWVPDQAGYELAIMEGLDPNRELLKFRDYWQAAAGTKGVKSDWLATWRNWCRSNYNKPGQSHAATELAVSTGMDLLTPINQQFPRGEQAHERGENSTLAIAVDDPDGTFGDE